MEIVVPTFEKVEKQHLQLLEWNKYIKFYVQIVKYWQDTFRLVYTHSY